MKGKKCPVILKKGNLQHRFDSYAEASRFLGVYVMRISRAAEGKYWVNGYKVFQDTTLQEKI